MKRELGKNFQQGEERRQFLADNADAVEKKKYIRHFTLEELLKKKLLQQLKNSGEPIITGLLWDKMIRYNMKIS